MAPQTKPDLTLIVFPESFGCRNPSPFCIKAEILLHMSGLPYQIERSSDPRVGPLGKLPALRDGDRMIGDSELIRQYLATHYQVDFYGRLSSKQRAVAHAFARMLEERTYWTIVHSRWMDETNWPVLRTAFFSDMPAFLRQIVPALVRRRVRRDLQGHGLGLHRRAELEAFALDDLKAVADWLGDQPFMMGETPTALDATVYGLLVSFVQTGFESPMRDMIINDMRLAGYLARCDLRWFDDRKAVDWAEVKRPNISAVPAIAA